MVFSLDVLEVEQWQVVNNVTTTEDQDASLTQLVESLTKFEMSLGCETLEMQKTEFNSFTDDAW